MNISEIATQYPKLRPTFLARHQVDDKLDEWSPCYSGNSTDAAVEFCMERNLETGNDEDAMPVIVRDHAGNYYSFVVSSETIVQYSAVFIDLLFDKDPADVIVLPQLVNVG